MSVTATTGQRLPATETLAVIVHDVLEGAPGRFGVAVRDLATGAGVEHRADEIFPSASTIKVPVLLALLREVDRGRLSLDERVTLPEGQRVGGSGVLPELPSVTALPLRELLALMIVVSDNEATNVLIDRVGLGAVAGLLADAGAVGTRLSRHLMDLEAAARGLDNLATAADLVAVFAALAGGRLLSGSGTDLALGILRRQQFTNRLPALLPTHVTVAHKTGEVHGVCHDAGIIEAGERRVAVAVLSDGLGDEGARGAMVIAEIGRAVYDTLLR
ncbi:MAG: serine hydrolase [Streptosporangiaceae bacterium]